MRNCTHYAHLHTYYVSAAARQMMEAAIQEKVATLTDFPGENCILPAAVTPPADEKRPISTNLTMRLSLKYHPTGEKFLRGGTPRNMAANHASILHLPALIQSP